jgi:hypothetical protein
VKGNGQFGKQFHGPFRRSMALPSRHEYRVRPWEDEYSISLAVLL